MTLFSLISMLLVDFCLGTTYPYLPNALTLTQTHTHTYAHTHTNANPHGHGRVATLGCVNKTYPTTDCCSGDIEIDSSIISLPKNAFAGCLITSVSIPDSVLIIGENAFFGNQLTSEKTLIGNNTNRIEKGAFGHNLFSSLPKIPSSVTYLSGFDTNELTSVSIPDSVLIIGECAFYRNKITSLLIGMETVIDIEDCSFDQVFDDDFMDLLNAVVWRLS